MPNALSLFPTFHTSNIKPWKSNDDIKFPSPSRTPAVENPGPIVVDGVEEYSVDSIIDHRKEGRGHQYLVHFRGCGSEDDRWIAAGREMEDNEALDMYQRNNPQDFPQTLQATPSGSTINTHPLRITPPHLPAYT
jgi:hypothetical protein